MQVNNTTNTSAAADNSYYDDSYFTFDEREELTTFQEFLTCQDPERILKEPKTHAKKADHFDLLAQAISHAGLVQAYNNNNANSNNTNQARDDDLVLDEEEDDEDDESRGGGLGGGAGGDSRGAGGSNTTGNPGAVVRREATVAAKLDEAHHHDDRRRERQDGAEVELRHIEDEPSFDCPTSSDDDKDDTEDEMGLNQMVFHHDDNVNASIDNGNETDVASNVSGSALSSTTAAGSGGGGSFKPVFCDEDVAYYVKQSKDIMNDVKTSCQQMAHPSLSVDKSNKPRAMSLPRMQLSTAFANSTKARSPLSTSAAAAARSTVSSTSSSSSSASAASAASAIVKALVDKIETAPPSASTTTATTTSDSNAQTAVVEIEQKEQEEQQQQQDQLDPIIQVDEEEQEEEKPAVKAIIQKMESGIDEGCPPPPPTPTPSMVAEKSAAFESAGFRASATSTSTNDQDNEPSSSLVKKMIQSWNRSEPPSSRDNKSKVVKKNKVVTVAANKSSPQVVAKRVLTPSKMRVSPVPPKDNNASTTTTTTTKAAEAKADDHQAHNMNAFALASPARKRVIEIRKKKVASKAVELGKLHHQQHHQVAAVAEPTDKKVQEQVLLPAKQELPARRPASPSSKEMMIMLKQNGIVAADSTCSTDGSKGPAVEKLANLYDTSPVSLSKNIVTNTSERCTPPLLLSTKEQQLQEMMTPKVANTSGKRTITSGNSTTSSSNDEQPAAVLTNNNNTVESSIRVSGGTRKIIITIDFPPEASKFLPANGELNPKVTVKLQDE